MTDIPLASFDHPLRPASSPSDDTTTASAPFVLELRSENLQSNGAFTPSAAVWVTPALRESGLIALLSPEEWQTLLLVVSCVTSNGRFIASAELLAPQLRLWPRPMRARLHRLARRRWKGEPLLLSQTTESGLRLFMPSPALFEVRHSLVFPAPARGNAPLEVPPLLQEQGTRLIGGVRDQVIDHSRAAYTRSRAEVEAEINQRMGYDRVKDGRMSATQEAAEQENEATRAPLTSEEAARRELAQRLRGQGLSQEQAFSLVEAYSAERIEAQLLYLPYRRARHPAGMLIAAIEGDYAAPLGMRPRPVPVTVPKADGVEQELNGLVQAPGAEGESEEEDVFPKIAEAQLAEADFDTEAEFQRLDGDLLSEELPQEWPAENIPFEVSSFDDALESPERVGPDPVQTRPPDSEAGLDA